MNRHAAILGLLLLPASLGAQTKNPDRYPSVGINIETTNMYGAASVDAHLLGLGVQSQDTHMNMTTVGIDVRLPITNSITLSANVGRIWTDTLNTATPVLLQTRTNYSGNSIGGGVRYYFE